MEPERKVKKLETGSILFALFILLLGVCALIFKVSILTGIFNLLRLWPLLFVGIGVWLIFKTVNLEKVGVVVLALMLAGAMYMAFAQQRVEMQLASSEEEAVGDATSLNVSADLVFGTFNVGSTPEKLFISRGYNYPLQVHITRRGGTAYLDFSLRGERITPWSGQQNIYDILLNQALPLSLTADAGLSTCVLDLSRLNVKEFTLNGGLSSADITFGETNTKAVLGLGLSSVKIHVPQSVGVKIVSSSGLATLSVPPGWVRTGDGYKSPNYDTASYKVEITCTMGMSTVEVSYV